MCVCVCVERKKDFFIFIIPTHHLFPSSFQLGIAFWVHRDLQVGGIVSKEKTTNQKSNRFGDIFDFSEDDSTSSSLYGGGGSSKTETELWEDKMLGSMRMDSLKQRICQLTHIPISHQKLWHNKTLMSNPVATLRCCGVGHGSELLIRCRTQVQRFSSSGTRLPQINATAGGIHETTVGAHKPPPKGYRWYNMQGIGGGENRSSGMYSGQGSASGSGSSFGGVMEFGNPAEENSTTRESAATNGGRSRTQQSFMSQNASCGHNNSLSSSSSTGVTGGGGQSSRITKEYDINCTLLSRKVLSIPAADAGTLIFGDTIMQNIARNSGAASTIAPRDSTLSQGPGGASLSPRQTRTTSLLEQQQLEAARRKSFQEGLVRIERSIPRESRLPSTSNFDELNQNLSSSVNDNREGRDTTQCADIPDSLRLGDGPTKNTIYEEEENDNNSINFK